MWMGLKLCFHEDLGPNVILKISNMSAVPVTSLSLLCNIRTVVELVQLVEGIRCPNLLLIITITTYFQYLLQHFQTILRKTLLKVRMKSENNLGLERTVK
jgi:hypothetical protein